MNVLGGISESDKGIKRTRGVSLQSDEGSGESGEWILRDGE